MSYDEKCFKCGWEFIRAYEEYKNLEQDIVPESDRIKMTALFKQATMGDMGIDLSSEDGTYEQCFAWKSFAGTPKHEAMLMYVNLARELCTIYSSDNTNS